ncbi:hypothetical protein HPB51_008849 [Rhipicephalus microplus]|uniref:Uncharacterized protein n=1 Tax=Rhipicephalus microplus TaxID=6941 RepID=A0A9J6ESG3_RHIMP|nr:hypothetical protein HPB51_008849 [Rhipicephalus microplus]
MADSLTSLPEKVGTVKGVRSIVADCLNVRSPGTIQNLNLVKRLVKEAENDHYALFNTYQFLKKCGYWEALLQRAINEGSVVATPEGREVIELLQERLAANALAGSQVPVRNSA